MRKPKSIHGGGIIQTNNQLNRHIEEYSKEIDETKKKELLQKIQEEIEFAINLDAFGTSNVFDGDKISPIIVAIQLWQYDIIKILLENGTNLRIYQTIRGERKIPYTFFNEKRDDILKHGNTEEKEGIEKINALIDDAFEIKTYEKRNRKRLERAIIRTLKVEYIPVYRNSFFYHILHRNNLLSNKEFNFLSSNTVDVLDKRWIFTNNILKYKYSPNILHKTSFNPYLVHYEVYQNKLFPIVTVPKGTVLYTYSQNTVDLYNISDITTVKPRYEGDNKFFYPIPFASEVVGTYSRCNIVTTTDDIKLSCFISPSPLMRSNRSKLAPVLETIPHVSYYTEKEIVMSCDNPFQYDLCLSEEFKKKMNVQGYIAIAEADSFSNDYWKKVIDTYKDYFTKVLRKAACSSGFYNDATVNNLTEFFIELDTIGFPYEMHQPDAVTKRIIGIPEIVLSPLKTENYGKITRLQVHEKSVQSELSEEDYMKLFNYKPLKVDIHVNSIRDVLEELSTTFAENCQYPLMHVYEPEIHKSYSKYTRPITSEPQNKFYNYKKSYSINEPSHCVFETFGNIDEIEYTITGGHTNNDIMKPRIWIRKQKTRIGSLNKSKHRKTLKKRTISSISTSALQNTNKVYMDVVNNIPIIHFYV